MLDKVARVRIAAGGNLLRRMMYWTVALGGVLSLGMNVAAVAQGEAAQPQAAFCYTQKACRAIRTELSRRALELQTAILLSRCGDGAQSGLEAPRIAADGL